MRIQIAQLRPRQIPQCGEVCLFSIASVSRGCRKLGEGFRSLLNPEAPASYKIDYIPLRVRRRREHSRCMFSWYSFVHTFTSARAEWQVRWKSWAGRPAWTTSEFRKRD